MGSTAARRRRAGGARAGALLAAVLAAGAVSACAGAMGGVPPGSLPDKNCVNLDKSECVASATCFFNVAANKCGPFDLPCSQYETPDVCRARPGCKGINVPHCLPVSQPGPPKPAPDPGCQGLRKKKCMKDSTCNWNFARKYAFGQPEACVDKMPNGCTPLQKRKMCNSNSACNFTKIFHCVSKKQIPPNCDCFMEICDACYAL